MNFIRILCADSLNNCMLFFKKNNGEKKHNISMEMNNKHEKTLYDEENEAFQDWPSDYSTSLKTNQSTTNNQLNIDTPILKIFPKPFLIGNIDEDKFVKKANVINFNKNSL